MITCPHCNHKDTEEIIGEDGKPEYKFNRTFYKLPVELKDSERYLPKSFDHLLGTIRCLQILV